MKRSLLLLLGGRRRWSFALDQWTKHWATAHAASIAPPVEVLGEFVRFTYTRNSGVAFGLGAGLPFPVLPVLDRRGAASSCGCSCAAGCTRPLRQLALALILGGALGNLVDRVTTGEVVDFIQIGWRPLALAGVQRRRLRGHGRRRAVRADLAARAASREAPSANARRSAGARRARDEPGRCDLLGARRRAAGERLDRFLAAAQTDLSRSRLQALIRDGPRARQRRSRRAPRSACARGDRVRVELPRAARASRSSPRRCRSTIVYEDEHLLVLDKPAGPGGASRRRRARAARWCTRCSTTIPRSRGVGGRGPARHRPPARQGHLGPAWSWPAARAPTGRWSRRCSAREVRRAYQALVWGDPRERRRHDRGRRSAAIRSERKRMAVVARGGTPARARAGASRERFGLGHALRSRRSTPGRTHQIRVHLAHLGHPVVGDPVYGGRAKKLLSLASAA